MSAESSAYLREDQRPESAALAETLQMAVHLRGQLQRGREDHRADVLLMRAQRNNVGVVVVQALDQRNQVRGCLARTRGSDAEKVAILDHHGNRLHLDGSRLLVFYVSTDPLHYRSSRCCAERFSSRTTDHFGRALLQTWVSAQEYRPQKQKYACDVETR